MKKVNTFINLNQRLLPSAVIIKVYIYIHVRHTGASTTFNGFHMKPDQKKKTTYDNS